MKAIVPARGNSKGIRRKNLQIVRGQPLLVHICRTLREAGHEVIVSTEDPEIASVAELHGYQVHDRDPLWSKDDVPISDVVEVVAHAFGINGPVIVAQPTCPNITVDTIYQLTHQLGTHDAATVAVPNTHILRNEEGRLNTPVNRQYMTGIWREVGVRVFSHPNLAHTSPSGLVEVTEWEGMDIDTIWELNTVRHPRKTIQFHTTGNPETGLGHVHRSLALATELQHHDILFHLSDASGAASDMVRSAGYPLIPIAYPAPDLAVIDQLDTSTEQVARLKAGGSLVVTIEDLGPGRELADLTVNALYGTGSDKTGGRWADLRPEFVGLPPFNIRHPDPDKTRLLLMFGGTDPANLAERFGKWFPTATVIHPGADISVASTMRIHDLLITSAGRTVYEAAAVGIPTIVVAANAREARHVHLGWEYGNVFLGHGQLVKEHDVRNTVDALMAAPFLRGELSERARSTVDGLGLRRIVYAVEGLLEGLV